MVLMSILTAATFLGIASCSNNQENIANSSDEQDNAISISENGRAWGFTSTPVLDKGKEAKESHSRQQREQKGLYHETRCSATDHLTYPNDMRA